MGLFLLGWLMRGGGSSDYGDIDMSTKTTIYYWMYLMLVVLVKIAGGYEVKVNPASEFLRYIYLMEGYGVLPPNPYDEEKWDGVEVFESKY